MQKQEEIWSFPTDGVPTGCEYERYIPPSQKDIGTWKHFSRQQQTFRDASQMDLELIDLIHDKIAWRKRQIMDLERAKRGVQPQLYMAGFPLMVRKMENSDYPTVVPETPEHM